MNGKWNYFRGISGDISSGVANPTNDKQEESYCCRVGVFYRSDESPMIHDDFRINVVKTKKETYVVPRMGRSSRVFM